jgi:hypothetical protein
MSKHTLENDVSLLAIAQDGLVLARMVIKYFGVRPKLPFDGDREMFDKAAALIAKVDSRSSAALGKGAS